MKFSLTSRGKWLLLAGLAAFVAAGMFWQNLVFASAAATAETRPELLRDAEWGKPVPAFSQQFRSGTPEAGLQRWLTENEFKLTANKSASRIVSSLPCQELIEVSWSAADGIIRESRAVVSEGGCL